MTPDHSSSIYFRTHDARTASGRKIVIWENGPVGRECHPIPVVIAGGFARAMHHFSPLATYLAHNGHRTLRFDFLDHVGLSDGDMLEFTLSGALRTCQSALDWARAQFGVEKVGWLATSLSARIVWQCVAEAGAAAYVISAVGVVHVQETLTRTFGVDYMGMTEDQLPAIVEFERKGIESARFWRDAHSGHWLTLADTIACLKRIQVPLVNFAATDDSWVDHESVRRAFAESAGAPRDIYELLGSTHEFAKNLSVARDFGLRSVALATRLAGLPEVAPAEPGFEELTSWALHDRQLQWESRARPDPVRAAQAAAPA